MTSKEKFEKILDKKLREIKESFIANWKNYTKKIKGIEMKDFEKWLKNDALEDGIIYDCYHDRDCRKGWKAALEMVLNDIACKGGILQNDFVIRQCIREELEK